MEVVAWMGGSYWAVDTHGAMVRDLETETCEMTTSEEMSFK